MSKAFSMSSTELDVLSRSPLCVEAPLSLLDNWVAPDQPLFHPKSSPCSQPGYILLRSHSVGGR